MYKIELEKGAIRMPQYLTISIFFQFLAQDYHYKKVFYHQAIQVNVHRFHLKEHLEFSAQRHNCHHPLIIHSFMVAM